VCLNRLSSVWIYDAFGQMVLRLKLSLLLTVMD
jgi:hypothetical protein